MKSIWRSEAEFQAACYKTFMATYPEQWGQLIAVYNNPTNIGQLITMGLRPGITDFQYHVVTPMRQVVWIELKILGKRQNDAQVKFEALVTGWGDEYRVITESVNDFMALILKYNNHGK